MVEWNTELFQQGADVVNEVLNSLYAYLPQFVLALGLILFGYAFGKILEWFTIRMSEFTRFDKLTQKTGVDETLRKIGFPGTTPKFIGYILKWIIYIIFIIAAIQVLFGEKVFAGVFLTAASYLPKVIGAIVIIIGGLILSDILGKVIGKLLIKSEFKGKQKPILAILAETATKILIFLAALAIAIDMLGIYPEIFTVSFALIFGSIVLLVLVGGRDILLNLSSGLYLQTANIIHKGMKITINDIAGEIVEIGNLYTTIKTGKTEVQIPNHIFLKEKIIILE